MSLRSKKVNLNPKLNAEGSTAENFHKKVTNYYHIEDLRLRQHREFGPAKLVVAFCNFQS